MSHPKFEFIRSEEIPTLQLTLEEYRHSDTGARHFHLASEDDNNVFLVAFLTVPQDSTGVAHILEHTSLCGSDRYPVRDPFFMMTRRSLNTFMNAFTSSDWTAYPFASRNRKDFDNLLQVYLDAAFFPKLDELDFLQEGHRIEFEKADDPNSDLQFKGVVYNEMKGAMSTPTRQFWQDLHSELFPTVTYHYNSGGDPVDIPNLTHEQLKSFHARHYHPSNSLFFTYGDITAEEHQQRIHDLALSKFERLAIDLAVPFEQRYFEPKTKQFYYPLSANEPQENKTHIAISWLLGDSTNPRELLHAHLMSGVLLDNSSSPLRLVLETTDLASAPSDLCGLDDSTREFSFVAGVEGSTLENVEAVEQLIFDTLEKVATEGVPQEQIESILHQLELSQREIGGAHFPYGLQLIVNALGTAIHGGDPARMLNIDALLDELHQQIKDPSFIKQLVRKWLLDNPHRVTGVLSPDTQLSKKQEEDEKSRLSAIKSTLTDQDKQRIVELAEALKQRQMQADDPDLLPKVTLDDVPSDLKIAEGKPKPVKQTPATWFAQGTNGIAYQQIVIDLPPLTEQQLDLLPLFTDCVTEVGVNGDDYLAVQARQAATVGGISSRVSLRSSIDDNQHVKGLFILSSKSLVRNQAAMTDLLLQTLEEARFDEFPRLRELIAQNRAHAEMSVTDRGHSLAMLAASAGMGPTGYFSQRWNGLASIKQLKDLDDSFKDSARLEQFGKGLTELRDILASAPRQLLVIGEQERHGLFEESLSQRWSGYTPNAASEAFKAAPVNQQIKEAWTTSTQVNFCALAFPTVPLNHPDSAALNVLGGFLRNGYLHRSIREQGGAYGGGASYDSDSGAFRFYSYRDPRLTETLDDYYASIDWLKNHRHQERTLEEAVLGVISSIDKPSSPAGEAISAFYGALNGRTPEQRRLQRQRILEVSIDDLKRVAETYLTPERASTAVITSEENLTKLEGLGLQHHAL